eukprot:450110-Alexandrium_andersonii.AAC.3
MMSAGVSQLRTWSSIDAFTPHSASKSSWVCPTRLRPKEANASAPSPVGLAPPWSHPSLRKTTELQARVRARPRALRTQQECDRGRGEDLRAHQCCTSAEHCR